MRFPFPSTLGSQGPVAHDHRILSSTLCFLDQTAKQRNGAELEVFQLCLSNGSSMQLERGTETVDRRE